MSLSSSSVRRLFATARSQAAYSVDPGVYTRENLPGLLASPIESPNDWQKNAIMLGSANGIRTRGVIIRPLGGPDSSDDEAFNVRVSLVRIVEQSLNKGTNAYIIEPIGVLTVTLGDTEVAADSGYGDEAVRIADTLVYTSSDLGDHYASAFTPAPLVHSPEDQTQAVFTIPDAAGAFAIVLDPDNSVGFNAMYELIS